MITTDADTTGRTAQFSVETSATRPSPPEQSGAESAASSRTRLLVLVAFCCVLGMVCWLQWRTLRAERTRFTASAAALARMQDDAGRIRALRRTPQRAAERERPNEELLAQIEAARKKAGLEQEVWRDSVPLAPLRLAHSSYQRHTTRIFLEKITLQQLMRLAHEILAADASLSITGLHLTAPAGAEGPGWNADLAVSYLVYSPGVKGASS